MRNVWFILIFTAACAWAQTDTGPLDLVASADVDLSGVESVQDLDFSTASLHQAGPDSFYVRSVGVGDQKYSLSFSQDSNGLWSLSGLNPESDNILPEYTVLDFASLTAVDANTLKIDGVFVDGEVYAGSLTISGEGALSLAESIESGNIDAVNQARAIALAELLIAKSAEVFQAEVERQRAQLEATIAGLEAERDSYKSERDSLAQTRDTLTAERDSLAAQLAAIPESEPASDAALTAEEVDALVDERDRLAGDLVGLEQDNSDLRDRNLTLAEQIADLQSRNTQLMSDLSDMTAEVERLTELVETYRLARGNVEDLPAAAPADTDSVDPEPSDSTETSGTELDSTPLWTLPGDYLRKADLESAAAAVTAELKALEGRVAMLETAAKELAGLEAVLRTGIPDGISPSLAASDQPGSLPGAGSTAAGEASAAGATDLTGELAALIELNETLMREKLELENRILSDILSDGLIAMMRGRMTDTVTSGFRTGEPDVGSWTVTGSRAVQSDSDAFFAKLALPARQSDKPMLYSFRARSLDTEGWVGVGLHFFVDDVELRRGYGMGKSLLVWLTRDPDVYKTRNTYLQLYRSDDDINMGRVLDAIIEEPISSFLDIEILYEPENQYLTVAVDGEDKVRYRTWFGIDSGVEIALRSLGAAEFTDFTIRTEPSESAMAPPSAPR